MRYDAGPAAPLANWLSESEFTLGMSSGFFGFYAHAGVLSALCSHGFRPSRVAGSSAGALIAGCYAAGLEPDDIKDVLFSLRRNDFWDPYPGFGLLRGAKFDAILRSLIGDKTFQDTRIPLSISVYDVSQRKTVVLKSGDLCSAIRASCALPIMFQPVTRDGRILLDGGIADRPGLAGVGVKEKTLYHHLLPTRLWRKMALKSPALPGRPETRSFVVRGLPKVSPLALHRGHEAFSLAESSTLDALKA